MSDVKERIIGAVTVMDEKEAERIWDIIRLTFEDKEWSFIPAEVPDETDMEMLEEIKADPECREFVSNKEAMKAIGL